MRLKLNGKKYRYRQEYYKIEDELKVKLPSYSISYSGKGFYNGKWHPCIFHFIDSSGKMKIFISPGGVFKEGMSDLGKVDSQGFVDKIEIKGFRRFLILFYDFLFQKKLQILGIIDRASLIRKNLRYISIALIGSIIYYLINHFLDGFLQDLINKSNLVQSIIVFLSLSSIVNIFHPFTFRKELKIEEVDELITKKIQKAEKEAKRKEANKKYYR